MEAVDLTGPVSFGHSWLGDGGNEVKICKADRLCLVAVDNDRARGSRGTLGCRPYDS